METRCENCNKLFRVADEKITGSGIKFTCTKCGSTVRITREDLDTYTLSKTAVSALDMFEPKPKLKPASILEPGPAQVEQASAPGTAVAQTSFSETLDSEHLSSSIPDFLHEQTEPSISEANPFGEVSFEDTPQPERQPQYESEPAGVIPAKPELEIGRPMEPEKTEPDHYPEPAIQLQETIPAKPEQQQAQEHKAVPVLDLVPSPKPKQEKEVTKPREPEVKPVVQPKPAPARSAVPTAVPKKEPVPPEHVDRESPQAEPSHSSRMVLVLVSAIILLGAVGFGVYKFALPSLQKTEQPAAEMTSIEGLRVVNPSGSVESNGDLLITGSVENLTDKERSGWYVVVDVYDANGAVLNKIRFLNGKQIYSRSDYEVLAKRGVNVPELKAKILENQGVVIPAKGSVPFEMHYIQPPAGMASFNATLQPFDPIRLFKEIERETK